MLSIITSLYKSENYLKFYLVNLNKVAKELRNSKITFEVIVVANDISFEEEILLSDFEKENKYLKIIKVKIESLYASWNRGVRISTYNNLTFWNVDDIRFSQALITGLNLLKKDFEIITFPFIYKRYIQLFGIDFLVKVKKVFSTKFDSNIYQKEMHLGPFFMFNKSIINKVGYFDENFKIAGDFDWQTRCARNEIKFQESHIIAGIFKNNGKTLSGSKNSLQKKENDLIQLKYIEL